MQGQKQSAGEQRDAGNRSNVTGGAQLDGFVQVVRTLLREAGLRDADVFARRSDSTLPGYYRASKQWDLVAIANGVVVACVEFKSQAGPSFGNNYNNRIEEALGNSVDFWKAYETGVFKVTERPFLGYIMLIEKCAGSLSPVVVAEPHFSVLPEFKGASYIDRYRIFGEKLMRERLYDAAALLISARDEELKGIYEEPSPSLTIKAFAAALMGSGFAASKRQ